MAQPVKVEESAFKDAIRSLLNTPPTSAATILRPKKKTAPRKRG